MLDLLQENEEVLEGFGGHVRNDGAESFYGALGRSLW